MTHQAVPPLPPSPLPSRDRSFFARPLFWVGFFLVLGNTIAHYLTPTTIPQYHHALRRLYYLPLVLVGVTLGVVPALTLAVLATLSYFPHIWTHWGGSPFSAGNLDRTLEALLWPILAGFTGWLAQRERSARRTTEHALALAENREQEANEANQTLLEAEERLRHADRMATIGFLAASLAHEVRNPLGSMRGIASLLRRKAPEDSQTVELIEILDQEVTRLEGVVEAYLDQARPSGGSSETSSVREAANAVLRLVGLELRKCSIECELQVTPRDLTLPIPTDLLRQILLNLVLNARQALGTEGGTIQIRGREDDHVSELCVEDDGPGFPGDFVGKEPRDVFTGTRKGSGFGLPIAGQLVDRQGGKLVLENRDEGGARVRIRFAREES